MNNYIQYNSSNKQRARENRKNQTESEKIIWNVLRKKQTGYLFLRQKMIGSFILDFYCSKLLLDIEIDGEIHDYKLNYDIIRDEKILDNGIKIIRYKNEDVFKNIDGVYKDLIEEIKIREKELNL